MQSAFMRSTVSAIALVAVAATAGATAYTDESAWRAAVSNVYAFENFDSLAAGTDIGTLPGLGIRFDSLNDGTQPTVQPYSFTGGIVRSGPNNLLNDRDNTLPARGPYNIYTIDPSDLLFGIGLWNVGGDDQLRMTFFDASDNIIEQVVSASGIGFFGIVNSGGAARVQIDFVGGNAYSPVDDLQTAVRDTFVPNPVPEPATVTMLLAGVGALGLRRRRKS